MLSAPAYGHRTSRYSAPHSLRRPGSVPALAHAVRVLQASGPRDRVLGAGEAQALSLIHHAYHEMMRAVAQRLLRDPDDAADTVQEVFGDLPRLIHGYRHQGLGGWLRRIVVTRALMKLRRRRLHEAVLADAGLRADPFVGFDDTDERVRAALLSVPVAAREIVVLRFFLQMTHREIAETLGISSAASEVRLCRALQEMRDRLHAPTLWCNGASRGRRRGNGGAS